MHVARILLFVVSKYDVNYGTNKRFNCHLLKSLIGLIIRSVFPKVFGLRSSVVEDVKPGTCIAKIAGSILRMRF